MIRVSKIRGFKWTVEIFKPKLSGSHYKISRSGVLPVLIGELTGQTERLYYLDLSALGRLKNKNRSI